MTFDFQRFLTQRGIHYVTSGKNVKAGHINIRCPFCGAADPSEHMGISLRGEGWGCWRNKNHRGRRTARLVAALLGCSFDEAARITGEDRSTYIPENFLDRVKALVDPPVSESTATDLDLPAEFKAFRDVPTAAPFLAYLLGRGYTRQQALGFSEKFGLRYCMTGVYRYRVIFPVRFHNRLVGWTGRTIAKAEKLRYKSLSPDPEKSAREGYPPAVGRISDYLLWHDELLEPRATTIVLCEGPFDALRVRLYGAALGITATCVFGASPSERQIELLHAVLPRYRRRWWLGDQGALPMALAAQRALASLDVERGSLPAGVKDPGELLPSQLSALAVDRPNSNVAF